MRNKSIGIFDSGFGGLTVMRAIRQLLPFENIVYFGDTARLPYGNKSTETILRYSRENADFLLSQNIKLLVVACNTACACAIDKLTEELPLPVIGVMDSAVDVAVQTTETGKIALLGTHRTIASSTYQELFYKRLPHAEIFGVACPLFVPLVEEGYIEHPLTQMVATEYLRPLQDKGIDTALLACTHYPILQEAIQKALGKEVALIDPAAACARAVFTLLEKNNLFSENVTELPRYQFFVSDDPEKFRLLGKTFLNYPLEDVSTKML